MIPVSLQLRNFLSYGDEVPPLDFNEFNVACLSGNNGHGKSAILDAMTWALWGEARKASGDKSASEGLLRIGTPEMQVSLEFDLEGDRYQVIRNYKRKGRKSRLDFQVFDEKSNGYKALTEKSSRATQEKINATLRMNYDTFINSAFILQGRVDEFTKKTPTKRKEILAEILDLSRYDRLTDMAKEAHRAAKGECQVLTEQLEYIDEELKHKAEYQQKLTELEQQLAEIDATLKQVETQRETLEKHVSELQGRQTQLDERKRQQKQVKEELKRLKGRKTRQQKQIDDVRALLEQEEEILKRFERYTELQQQDKQYNEKLRQKNRYESQKSDIEKQIQKARHEIEKKLDTQQAARTQIQKNLKEVEKLLQKAEEIEQSYQELQESRKQDETLEETRSKVETFEKSIRQLDKEIEQEKNQLTVELQTRQRYVDDLRKKARTLDTRKKEAQTARKSVIELEKFEQEWEQNKEDGPKCGAQCESLQNTQQHLQETIQDLTEKLDLLKRSAEPQCPVCKSDLDGHKKEDLEQHFQDDIRSCQAQEQSVTQELTEAHTRLDALRKEYRTLEQQIKKRKGCREKLLHAENALHESQQAASELAELEPQLAALRDKIQEKAYAQESFAKREEIQNNITILAYNSKAHQALKKRLKTLQKFESEYARLKDARERYIAEKEALPAFETEISRLETQLDQQDYAREEQARLQDILSKIAELGYDEQAHTQIRKELEQLQNAPQQKYKLDDARDRIVPLEQELTEILADQQKQTDHLAAIEEQIKSLETELKQLPAVKQELEQVKKTFQTHSKQRDDVLQTRGTYQNKYEHCTQLEAESEEKRKEQQQTEKDKKIYKKLHQIFGRDGIQAHLIENAIPEIEHEANEILGKLTDNRTHITIERVKDLQSGKTRETLDIKISDEMGTRNYEMYSGGEAFRVDFAIRIALSKLLATRAGTKLKTLVIDEGFGTQDTHGLEQLVEAITAISTDFEKILVITHLEALKDAFPTRIEVVKHPDTGSQYQIVH